MKTLTANTPQNITLYYREGTSDKVYQCAIEPAGNGLFAVTFAYGRRGSTLNTGCKTSSPVDYDEARRLYDKLVREKMAKGYTPGADGMPYRNSPAHHQPSGYLPQLLNPIEEDEVQRLLQDTGYCAQEKFDGCRLLLRKEGAAVEGINRRGLVVGLSESILTAFRAFPMDCVIDGEAIGDVFHAFDLLHYDGRDLRPAMYRERLPMLSSLLSSVSQRAIRFAETACTPTEKMRLLDTLKALGKEGIVFKRWNAAYTPGRPNSGGAQLKHKFYATLSAVVSKVNAQRSVEIRLLGKEGWQVAGNVTIPPNRPIPGVSQIVELRYLYAFAQSGIVYQPVYLGVRSDLELSECTVSQLKYKSDAIEAEAA